MAGKRKKAARQESIPQLQPPWRLIWHRESQKQYYYNNETKEVVWPNQFATRFGNTDPDNGNSKNSKIPETSKAIVKKLPEFHADNFASTSDSVEPMEVDYVNEVLHAYRKDSKDDKKVLDQFTNKRLTEIDYRNTRNMLIVVFDTSSLLHDPLIVRKTGTAKIQMRIPYTVLCELDGLKKSEKLRPIVNAVIKDLIATSDTSPDLVSFENSLDSRLSFTLKSEVYSHTAPFVATTADERILKTALVVKEYVNKPAMKIVLVSNDFNLRAKAIAHSISAVDNTAFFKKYLEPLQKMKAENDGKMKHENDGQKMKPEKRSKSDDNRGRTMHRRSDPPSFPPSSNEDVPNKKKRRVTEPISQRSSSNIVADRPSSRNSNNRSKSPDARHLHSIKNPRPSADTNTTYRQNNEYKSKVPPSVSTQMVHNPSREITKWDYPESFKAFLFATELAKFQYMIRISVEKTLEPANRNWEKLLFKLCDAGYRFVTNEFKEEDLNEFILQLEELYEKSVTHLNKHQRIDRQKLIGELKSDGVDGEGIKAIKDCADYVKNERGWSPSLPACSNMTVTPNV